MHVCSEWMWRVVLVISHGLKRTTKLNVARHRQFQCYSQLVWDGLHCTRFLTVYFTGFGRAVVHTYSCGCAVAVQELDLAQPGCSPSRQFYTFHWCAVFISLGRGSLGRRLKKLFASIWGWPHVSTLWHWSQRFASWDMEAGLTFFILRVIWWLHIAVELQPQMNALTMPGSWMNECGVLEGKTESVEEKVRCIVTVHNRSYMVSLGSEKRGWEFCFLNGLKCGLCSF